MNTDNGRKAASWSPKEFEMSERVMRANESRTRIEPIFDASGALKRHVLHKKDATRPEQSGDAAPKKE
jgi:hypothetical protein